MIEEGKLDPLDNPLKNAPHPVTVLTATNWDRPYPREMACSPAVSNQIGRHLSYINGIAICI